MIVVDSSALIAILLEEPESAAFAQILAAEDALGIATPTAVECGIVALRKHGPTAAVRIRELMSDFGIERIAFDAGHLDLALEGYARFGKPHHPAKLNFGDCMAYALAKSLDAPLLFKGGDFAKTDIRSAL